MARRAAPLSSRSAASGDRRPGRRHMEPIGVRDGELAVSS
jgi:hypothetical protein